MKFVMAAPAVYRFQSSPARGGGCNVAWELAEPFVRAVSILTRPWGRVQCALVQRCDCATVQVSILTRPWGRVQPVTTIPSSARRSVSILTRPWGRVQRSLRPARWITDGAFQSSPARGGGCNALRVLRRSLSHPRFQSSPARGGGCNRRILPAARDSRTRFNPHPPVGAGATNYAYLIDAERHRVVSILTRPWGRVQP